VTAPGRGSDAVGLAVKRVLVLEARLPIAPEELPDAEPLNGGLLAINSLGLLGMLIHLEDELEVTLPDDLFLGQTFSTVADLIDVVARGAKAGP
jgi:acyl carrier protein